MNSQLRKCHGSYNVIRGNLDTLQHALLGSVLEDIGECSFDKDHAKLIEV